MPDYSVVHSSDPKVNAFEEELKTKSGTDLLDAWYNYICYVEAKHPRKQWILLMRRCILHYRKSTEFNNTVKFVKIWLNLAAALDQPELVYAKMDEKQIGTSLAIFYRDWAQHCAHQGSQDEVEKILEKAEHRNAGPSHIIAKCKEELLTTNSAAESSDSLQLENRKKINRSHYYYDPNALSAPGTVVAYHKASVYGESYERSFEELKAKLPRYSVAKKNKKPCSTCGGNSGEETTKRRDSSVRKSACDNASNNEDHSQEGNIDVDKEVFSHLNDSSSFLEDYMSPSSKPDSSLQHYEAILRDLEVTRHTGNILKGARLETLSLPSECDTNDNGSAEEVGIELEKTVQWKDDTDRPEKLNDDKEVTQCNDGETENVLNCLGTPVVTANLERTPCQPSSSNSVKGRLDASGTPGANTRKIMDMFSDTLAWEPDNNTPDLSRNNSFDRQFEKSESFKGRNSSVESVTGSVKKSALKKSKPFDIFHDSKLPESRDSTVDVSLESSVKLCEAPKCVEIFEDSNILGSTDKKRSFPSSGIKHEPSLHEVSGGSDLGKSPLDQGRKFDVTQTVCTQNIMKMFSTTITDFDDQSGEIASAEDGPFSKKLRKPFQGQTLNNIGEESSVIKPKAGSTKFSIFQDEPTVEVKHLKLLEKVEKDLPANPDMDESTLDDKPKTKFSIFQDEPTVEAKHSKLSEVKAMKKKDLPDNQDMDQSILVDKPRTKFSIFQDEPTVEVKHSKLSEVKAIKKDLPDNQDMDQSILVDKPRTKFSIFQDEPTIEVKHSKLSEGKEIKEDLPANPDMDQSNFVDKPRAVPSKFEIFQDEPTMEFKHPKLSGGVKKALQPLKEIANPDMDQSTVSTSIFQSVSPIENVIHKQIDLDTTGTPGVPKYESTAYFGIKNQSENESHMKSGNLFSRTKQMLSDVDEKSPATEGKIFDVTQTKFHNEPDVGSDRQLLPKGLQGEEKNSSEEVKYAKSNTPSKDQLRKTIGGVVQKQIDLDTTGTPGAPKYESTSYFGVKKHTKNEDDLRSAERIDQVKQLLADMEESPSIAQVNMKPVAPSNRRKSCFNAETPGVPKYESTAYLEQTDNTKNTQPGIQSKENIMKMKMNLKQLSHFSDSEESPDFDMSKTSDTQQGEENKEQRKRERADLFGAGSKLKEGSLKETSIKDPKDNPLKRQKQILAELSNLEELSEPDMDVDFLSAAKKRRQSVQSKNIESIFDVSHKTVDFVDGIFDTKKSIKDEVASLFGSPLQEEHFSVNQTQNFEKMFEKDSNVDMDSIIQSGKPAVKKISGLIQRDNKGSSFGTGSMPNNVEKMSSLTTYGKKKFSFEESSLNNDSVQTNAEKRKRSLSGNEDSGLKKFISTPSSPGRNQNCITFNQQVSRIVPNINFEKTNSTHNFEKTDNTNNFEKTETQDSVHLSPIAERSNEDSKGENTKGSGESCNETTKGSAVTCNETNYVNKSSNVHDTPNVFQLSFDDLKISVKKIIPVLQQCENFKEVAEPLPKVRVDTMSLDIGSRSVKILKSIEKNDSYTLYSGIEGRKNVRVKCLEKTRLAFYQSLWDLYIGNEIHRRINCFSSKDFLLNQDNSILENFLHHNLVCIFEDSIYVESKSSSGGGDRTVMDTVDLYRNNKCVIDEALALLYTYNILNIVHTLHKVGILHSDLNPNVFLQQTLTTDCKPVASRFITLSNFSMSVDLTIVDDYEKASFSRSSANTTYPCPEMRTGKPWKYNADYYSSASTIHMIAFQCEMDGDHDLDRTLSGIRTVIPGHWNTSLWMEIFSTLLVKFSLQPVDLITLITKVGARLSDPKVMESLKQAELRTFEMWMMDEEDDDDDDDDDEEDD